MAKNSHQADAKAALFQDFSQLLAYTQTLITEEHQSVKDIAVTYLAQRAPSLWHSAEIKLIIVLARLESQLNNLSSQHTLYLSKEGLTPDDIKAIKNISQTTASIVTQIHTLTTRLGVSAAQLHGSAMRSESTNNNSRSVAQLALEQSNNTTTTKESELSYEEAKARFAQKLKELHPHE